MEQLLTITSLTVSLFLLMDPIGNVPIYISVLKGIDPKRQKKIIIRELLIALGIIFLFVFIGDGLLNLLGISAHTVLIAGGIILFIIALKMIFPSNSPLIGYEGEPFIVPLAVPLIAGPSILAAVIIYSHQEPIYLLSISLLVAWFFSMIILMASSFLNKVLGQKGITACERLMGLILTLIAVQMFLEGVKSFVSINQ